MRSIRTAVQAIFLTTIVSLQPNLVISSPSAANHNSLLPHTRIEARADCKAIPGLSRPQNKSLSFTVALNPESLNSIRQTVSMVEASKGQAGKNKRRSLKKYTPKAHRRNQVDNQSNFPVWI